MKTLFFGLVFVFAIYFTEAKNIPGQQPVLVVKRDVVSQAELLLKLAQLLSKSKLAQELLAKEGKPLLAAGLKKVDELLHSLDEKVRNASPHTEVGKLALKGLDALIIKAEELLEKELKKIEDSKKPVSVQKRDIKSQAELLLKLAELLSKSKLAQDLLAKEGKPLLAAGLKKIDELLHKLEEKVKNANPKTEVGKLALKGLDELLLKAEEKLEEELKKIQDSKPPVFVYKRDVLKDGLLEKAKELLKTAKGAIDFLKAQGKSIEAAELQVLINVVSDVEHRLESLEPKTEIGKLIVEGVERLLKDSEAKLSDLLHKLDAHP